MHGRQLAAWHGGAAGPAPATQTLSVGSCRGEYQAARQPRAWQYTTRCPGVPRACGQRRGALAGDQDTIIRSGPPLAAVRALRG